MNTNKNSYTIIYASVMVIIVAFLLAFVSSALKPVQDQNVALDKKKQILAALRIRNLATAEEVEAKYNEVVVADMVVDSLGNVLKDGKGKDKDGFAVASKDVNNQYLPVYACIVNKERKYVVPMTGRGLWGGLWGYMAVNDDLRTIYGAYFSHESETAGLGALIADEPFQRLFNDKQMYADTACAEVALTVVKHGKVEPGKENYQVDGITGATLTSVGVANMVHDGLTQYQGFFQSLRAAE
ncbi:MAG: NADH:ubiquinone reductase (Na(+)-transporting) subunit C [Bacteroidales bacterium]|nr:NADH:ubiquinone reductase (Na(+)-transporting) subunit C [Bacteroidales bacterium]